MHTEIFANGKSASFCADDRIFLGEGLFETILIDQQRPCYSSLHWQRMRQAAILLGISFEVSFDLWSQQLAHCIQQAGINDGGAKVILCGGKAPRGLDVCGVNSSLIFEAFRFQPNQQAMRLLSAPWRRDARNPIYQLKSINYLESILARRKAIASGADEALFFNQENYATETTVANLFILKQDQIFTPKLTDGLLAGIIRDRVIALCQGSGTNCTEISIDASMIVKADAVFVTNALQRIRFVESFDGNELPVHHPLVITIENMLANDEARW